MIYVTGGRGWYLGRELVQALTRSGHRVRALVGSPEEGKALQAENVEIVVGDCETPSTFAHTLDGADVAMMITRNSLKFLEMEMNFINAARAARMGRVVKLSALGADANDETQVKRAHGQAEEFLKQSGLEWTILRPHFFMQNVLWFADEIRSRGTLSLPMKSARFAIVDYRDIAAVAARCLTQSGHEGRTYTLSGPELLSFYDVAVKLSRALGVPVRYNDIQPDEFRDLLISLGRPAWHAESITRSYVLMSRAATEELSADVEHVLGRRPTPFDKVAEDYARLLRAGS
jgi:uncharacterized protein YbjT (DUF2867 family)